VHGAVGVELGLDTGHRGTRGQPAEQRPGCEADDESADEQDGFDGPQYRTATAIFTTMYHEVMESTKIKELLQLHGFAFSVPFVAP
jgi:hypothetical protein